MNFNEKKRKKNLKIKPNSTQWWMVVGLGWYGKMSMPMTNKLCQ